MLYRSLYPGLPTMKQLIIEPLKNGDGQLASGLHLGMPVHRGVPIPRHMVAPGQDGYRTPMIEDYEQESTHQVHQLHQIDRPSNGLSDTRLDVHRRGLSSAHSLNLNSLNSSPTLLEKLEWRERIRHFTWTFFTLTMATGRNTPAPTHETGWLIV